MWAGTRLRPGFWRSAEVSEMKNWHEQLTLHVSFSVAFICGGYGCFQASSMNAHRQRMAVVVREWVCCLCDDTQASDLLHLRLAAGVPDPGVMWPGLPEVPAEEPEPRPGQGQSTHVMEMWSHIFMRGLLGGWGQHSYQYSALYNLSFTVTSVSGVSWKLPENAAVWMGRFCRETFQTNKCADQNAAQNVIFSSTRTAKAVTLMLGWLIFSIWCSLKEQIRASIYVETHRERARMYPTPSPRCFRATCCSSGVSEKPTPDFWPQPPGLKW